MVRFVPYNQKKTQQATNVQLLPNNTPKKPLCAASLNKQISDKKEYFDIPCQRYPRSYKLCEFSYKPRWIFTVGVYKSQCPWRCVSLLPPVTLKRIGMETSGLP